VGTNVFSISLRFREFVLSLRENRFGNRAVVRFSAGSAHATGYKAAENDEIENYYNERVARGWESKSVEGQQADASEKPAEGRPRLSAEEAAHARERESLRLSRQRVLQQLEASQNPLHRQLLEQALADLDEKLGKMDVGRQT
jgi:hypothetical protein